jgi:hypothetical protein
MVRSTRAGASIAWALASLIVLAGACSSSSSSSGSAGPGHDGGADTASDAATSGRDAPGETSADAPLDSAPSGDAEAGAATCVGGIVIDGSCEAKCQPSLCLGGNTCVGNQCKLVCQSVRDCQPGQACVAATEDGTGMAVTICVADGKSTGIGTSCLLGTECSSLFTCHDGTACGASLCKGQACSGGHCPDGSPCTPATCLASECAAMTCFGKGPGDANAYCSSNDCGSDADCTQGMGCEMHRDPHAVCPATTASSACGKTSDPCIDPSAFMANGATYSQGPVCLMRKSCLVRGWCDACSSDADCSLVPGQHCKTVGPDKRCVADCAMDSDCIAGLHCSGGSCVPRYAGGCVGQGNFCEPCVVDEDCGSTGGTGACIQFPSGERACIDVSMSISCMVDTDCPTSPSGLHGQCLNQAAGYTSGTPGYDTCYAPYDGTTYRYGCW